MSKTPITTTPAIMSSFLDLFRNTFEAMNFVFDPALSEKTGLRRRHAWRDRVDVQKKDFPLFIWSRSPISARSELGERSRKKIYDDTLQKENDFDLVGSLWGETEVNFIIVHKNLRDFENIELVTSTFVFQNYQISIDLGDYGVHNFQLEWEDLTGFDLNYEDKYYLSLKGSCKIVGTYHTIIGDYPRLKRIIQDYYTDTYQEDLKETIIIDYTE